MPLMLSTGTPFPPLHPLFDCLFIMYKYIFGTFPTLRLVFTEYCHVMTGGADPSFLYCPIPFPLPSSFSPSFSSSQFLFDLPPPSHFFLTKVYPALKSKFFISLTWFLSYYFTLFLFLTFFSCPFLLTYVAFLFILSPVTLFLFRSNLVCCHFLFTCTSGKSLPLLPFYCHFLTTCLLSIPALFSLVISSSLSTPSPPPPLWEAACHGEQYM